jgi:hypothetical protein
MSKTEKISASDKAWDSEELGNDERYAAVADEDIETQIDEALELQLISIRLQKSLIDDFKALAKLNRVGYQPLMRQVLTRFADCEKKRVLRERVSEMQEKVRQAKEKDAPAVPVKQRKVA